MAIYLDTFDDTATRLIAGGGIGIIRTDTLYGIVARADNEQAVQRLYEVKRRTPSKSPIVLLSSIDQLFDSYDASALAQLDDFWPGKNSIILPSDLAPHWIVRDNKSVAYRIPDNAELRDFLSETGPLIAPSANPEGLHPAMTVQEAKDYFGDSVDFYVDGGRVEDDSPSRLYRLTDGEFERLR